MRCFTRRGKRFQGTSIEITAQYKTICVPTLILWGRQDKIIPLEIGERLRQDIPNSRLEIIDKAGHIPQEEVPGTSYSVDPRIYETRIAVRRNLSD